MHLVQSDLPLRYKMLWCFTNRSSNICMFKLHTYISTLTVTVFFHMCTVIIFSLNILKNHSSSLFIPLSVLLHVHTCILMGQQGCSIQYLE